MADPSQFAVPERSKGDNSKRTDAPAVAAMLGSRGSESHRRFYGVNEMSRVERVAKAIALVYICERDARDADDDVSISYVENCWQNHENEARAAMLAMTEPDWNSHPVDVLKWCVGQMGRELDPEAEAKLRGICDEMVPLA